jgi:hydroxymethylpyrimidine/phosphomethylpyrimidine kinase
MSEEITSVPRALTIAGSDSGGGAGIQADLKTFAAFGVYGTSAITAVTAQNTLEVADWLAMPDALVGRQIDAVLSDIGADAVKTGMLANAGIIREVAAKMREHRVDNLVVDPVMVAKGGQKLLEDDAVEVLIRELLPLALVVTPNLPEAEVLTNRTIRTWDDAQGAAVQIVEMGARSVVIKGGHFDDTRNATDVFYDGRGLSRLHGDPHRYAEHARHRLHVLRCARRGPCERHEAGRRHRAGEVIRDARDPARVPIGHGHGPVHHFYRYWQPTGPRYRPGVRDEPHRASCRRHDVRRTGSKTVRRGLCWRLPRRAGRRRSMGSWQARCRSPSSRRCGRAWRCCASESGATTWEADNEPAVAALLALRLRSALVLCDRGRRVHGAGCVGRGAARLVGDGARPGDDHRDGGREPRHAEDERSKGGLATGERRRGGRPQWMTS